MITPARNDVNCRLFVELSQRTLINLVHRAIQARSNLLQNYVQRAVNPGPILLKILAWHQPAPEQRSPLPYITAAYYFLLSVQMPGVFLAVLRK